MASPNLSELVTTTLRNRTGKAADNMTRNNVILTKLCRILLFIEWRHNLLLRVKVKALMKFQSFS